MSDPKRTIQDELEEANRYLDTIVENIPDGAAHDLAMIVRSAREAIIAWTPDGTVVTWNPAAEKLFAIDAAHAIGRDLARMMPEGLSRQFGEAVARLSDGVEMPLYGVSFRGRDGRELELEVSMFTFREEPMRFAAIV